MQKLIGWRYGDGFWRLERKEGNAVQRELAGTCVTLKVNSKEHQLPVRPRQTLRDVLRDELRFTGTKQGCEDGTCGICMVTTVLSSIRS